QASRRVLHGREAEAHPGGHRATGADPPIERVRDSALARPAGRGVGRGGSGAMLKATLVGNLGQDPEMRYSAEGRPVLTFRVASNYRTRSPEGEWQDRTEWVRVRVVGQRAESLAQYLRKGSRVYVDGRLEARPWLNNQQQPQSGLEIF